jgi:hypothetical protein
LQVHDVLTATYSFYITAHIGDTLHRVGENVDALPGFTPTKAMVGLRLPEIIIRKIAHVH